MHYDSLLYLVDIVSLACIKIGIIKTYIIIYMLSYVEIIIFIITVNIIMFNIKMLPLYGISLYKHY